ncbi:MAG: APC family permease [Coriobacteriia bacterium]|nr:APC family permease [Coriobacteriia bacterium]
MAKSLKNFFLGDPLSNEESQHQRLSNPMALAVFSSDAISSVAYASGEILLVLALAGAGFLHLAWPISLAIGVLLVIVVTSYRQTVRAYPQGGGSYRVAKQNLGTIPGLIAAGALLVDYVLTVAVSISAGTQAITSAFPQLVQGSVNFTVPLALFFVAVLAVGNLRGVKESGALFSGPTFIFILLMLAMVVSGIFIVLTQGVGAIKVPSSHEAIVGASGTLGLILLLRAFASGCTAMTGVEAIADGVQVFREPVSKNAAKTLTWMAGILLTLFLGITWLAVQAGVRDIEHETVISQLARQIFGTGLIYYLISFATMAILVIAANTSYADFPRLSSFLAADNFLPHQLKDRGYRLVHSNGILLLTGAAAALIIVFQGQTTRLIPLYALGVFTSFTMSQSGMVMRWIKKRDESHWKRSAVLNAVGAATTALVLVIITVAKFTEGAWAVVVIVPLLVLYFLWVERRYALVRAELALPADERVDLNWQAYNRLHNHVVVLVKAIDRRLVRALQYAKTLRADSTEAIFVDVTGEEAQMIREEWEEAGFGVKLTIIASPYREIIVPVIDYVRSFPRPSKDHIVTVILPEYAPTNIADSMLHDRTSSLIKQQLFGEEGVIVADVPYHPSFDEETRKAAASERTPQV